MIRLAKSAEPPVLAQNGAAWTIEFIDAINRGEDPTPAQKNRYRHQQIKDALILETHAKCAYCEWKLLVGAYGDIEHIIPKSLRPDLRFSWANLTLACDACNNKKRTHSDLVDPYNDDPEVHFRFLGPMLTVRPGSDAGKRTQVVLDLNRLPLLEHRKEKIDDFVRRVHEISATVDAQTKAILLTALVEDAKSASKEFAGCTRAFIRDMQSDGTLPT